MNQPVETPPAPDSLVDSPAPASPTAPQQSEPAAEHPQAVLGLTPGDRQVVSVLIVVAVVLMGLHWYRLTRVRPEPLQVLHPADYQFQLDINRATWVEWMQLDGVGEKLGKAIVADRERNGPFRSIDDLQRVKGIGPKTVERLRTHLLCRPTAASTGSAAVTSETRDR